MVIEVRDLTVSYRRKRALDRISVTLSGGVVGLLGPNGAGKTTLLSALATAGVITSGSIKIDENDLSVRDGRLRARAMIGWLPQRFDLAGGMTVLDAVRYAAWANGVSIGSSHDAAQQALAVVDLSERARDRVRHLSGGQRQRLGLAASLAHNPQVVLLDEPTVGLDPEQRVRFRSYLRTASEGRTIILATHLLEDVRHTCDELLVLLRGRIAFSGAAVDLAALDQGVEDPLESPLERGYRFLLEQASAASPSESNGVDRYTENDPPRGHDHPGGNS